ncbi:hypothetical protein H4219_006341, partial [Mycoemilia scoparia]
MRDEQSLQHLLYPSVTNCEARLVLENKFLVDQQRYLLRDLTHIRASSQALRQVVQAKDDHLEDYIEKNQQLNRRVQLLEAALAWERRWREERERRDRMMASLANTSQSIINPNTSNSGGVVMSPTSNSSRNSLVGSVNNLRAMMMGGIGKQQQQRPSSFNAKVAAAAAAGSPTTPTSLDSIGMSEAELSLLLSSSSSSMMHNNGGFVSREDGIEGDHNPNDDRAGAMVAASEADINRSAMMMAMDSDKPSIEKLRNKLLSPASNSSGSPGSSPTTTTSRPEFPINDGSTAIPGEDAISVDSPSSSVSASVSSPYGMVSSLSAIATPINAPRILAANKLVDMDNVDDEDDDGVYSDGENNEKDFGVVEQTSTSQTGDRINNGDIHNQQVDDELHRHSWRIRYPNKSQRGSLSVNTNMLQKIKKNNTNSSPLLLDDPDHLLSSPIYATLLASNQRSVSSENQDEANIKSKSTVSTEEQDTKPSPSANVKSDGQPHHQVKFDVAEHESNANIQRAGELSKVLASTYSDINAIDVVTAATMSPLLLSEDSTSDPTESSVSQKSKNRQSQRFSGLFTRMSGFKGGKKVEPLNSTSTSTTTTATTTTSAAASDSGVQPSLALHYNTTVNNNKNLANISNPSLSNLTKTSSRKSSFCDEPMPSSSLELESETGGSDLLDMWEALKDNSAKPAASPTLFLSKYSSSLMNSNVASQAISENVKRRSLKAAAALLTGGSKDENGNQHNRNNSNNGGGGSIPPLPKNVSLLSEGGSGVGNKQRSNSNDTRGSSSIGSDSRRGSSNNYVKGNSHETESIETTRSSSVNNNTTGAGGGSGSGSGGRIRTRFTRILSW